MSRKLTVDRYAIEDNRGSDPYMGYWCPATDCRERWISWTEDLAEAQLYETRAQAQSVAYDSNFGPVHQGTPIAIIHVRVSYEVL